MLYPLSYEGWPAVLWVRSLPCWLWSASGPRVWLDRSIHGWRRRQCLMVGVGRESGGDPVIDPLPVHRCSWRRP